MGKMEQQRVAATWRRGTRSEINKAQLITARSIAVQTENPIFEECSGSDHHDHDDKENCPHPEFNDDDKENYLWFICPLCYQSFARSESKLAEHKQVVHGISRKNRSAFIVSQTDISPKILLEAQTHGELMNLLRATMNNGPLLPEEVNLDIKYMPNEYIAEGEFSVSDTNGTDHPGSGSQSPEEFQAHASTLSPCYSDIIGSPCSDQDQQNAKNEVTIRNPTEEVIVKVEVEEETSESSNSHQIIKSTRSASVRQNSLSSPKVTTHVRKQRDQNSQKKINGPIRRIRTLKTYKCKFCQKFFDKKSSLVHHQLYSHNLEKVAPYHCDDPLCTSQFKTRSELNSHRRLVHLPKPFKCTVCGAGFIRESVLQQHSNTHTSNRPFKCPIPGCTSAYSTRGSLYCHKREKHQEESEMLEPVNKTCSTCGKECPSEKALKKHVKTHSDARNYLCSLCGKAFRTEGALKKHHNIIHLSIQPERRYTCATCGKKASTKSLLKQHELIHTSARPLQCHICQKAFKDVYGLRTHVKSHTGERKRHVCPSCGEAFTLSDVLQAHIIMKHGAGEFEYKYSCEVCGKKFPIERYLKKHATRHKEGERKYGCEICGKLFMAAKEVKRHLQVHEKGGKPRNRKLILEVLPAAADETADTDMIEQKPDSIILSL